MKKPEFIKKELYIISYYKSYEGKLITIITMDLGLIIGAALLTILGIANESTLTIAVTFAIYVFLKLWDIPQQKGYSCLLRDVLLKYDKAFTDTVDKEPI